MLACERCGASFEASKETWQCTACHGPLRWEVERRFDRDMIDRSASGLWRYAASLPVQRFKSISLGEVTTPLVALELDGVSVDCKLEYFAPTGSFKDRGAAVLISALRKLGASHAVEDSSGNAAAAISAYSAGAGIRCTVFAPAAASAGKLVQSAAVGAKVVRIDGSRDDVATAAMDAAVADPSATYASHNWHPFFIEGVKTWAFEAWEQHGFEVPDAIVTPVGSGSMLLGAYLAFSSLLNAGEIRTLPRLYAAQPAACAPIVTALTIGGDDTEPFPRTQTIAEGASIANPVRGRELLSAIRASSGGAVAVDEAPIAAALRFAASRGIYIEPTSAVAIAGARQLVRQGAIKSGERTVVVLSGSGLKATDTIGRLIEAGPVRT
jgi:threonine synthase